MRKKSQSKQGWLGALLVVFALIIVAAIGYLYMTLSSEVIDEATLCPKSGPRGYTAILIDATDPIEPAMADAIRGRLRTAIRQSPPGTMIALSLVRRRAEDTGAPIAPLSPRRSGPRKSAVSEPAPDCRAVRE